MMRGIPVGLHYSWFIIFFLITFSLTARFASEHAHWSLFEHYAVGIATSLLFFSSILFHEFAHSLVALAKGIPVRSITLFVFGGVAQIGREPDHPMTEFQIAIAGPIASALLAIGFGAIVQVSTGRMEHIEALAGWLSAINLVLAIFNLLPGFPLDGGRIFRAAIWRVTGSLSKATKVAARTGEGLGFAFIFFGIWTAFTVNWFSGLWMGFIGWFLLNAAQETVLRVGLRSAMSDIIAEDIMARNYPKVNGEISLTELIDQHILRTGQRTFLVLADGTLEGLVTLHQVKAVPLTGRNEVRVRDAMTPATELRVVDPQTPITQVLELMEEQDINQVPVTRGGRLLGCITRDHVLRMLLTKMELENATAKSTDEIGTS
ncbi:MAG: site-2 protease family protein, partial [Nitrospira sp.]|nr:site-2 protease family protein [Nitrospira sp.]